MINKDYINIDYLFFYNFCKNHFNIDVDGLAFSIEELNIGILSSIFKLINNDDCVGKIFICFDFPFKIYYDCFVIPFEINYYNNIIKPKFDKYLKLKVFI